MAGARLLRRRTSDRSRGDGLAPIGRADQTSLHGDSMNKRFLALVALGLTIPSVAFAASVAASCCPGLCCFSGCPLCP